MNNTINFFQDPATDPVVNGLCIAVGACLCGLGLLYTVGSLISECITECKKIRNTNSRNTSINSEEYSPINNDFM